VAGDRGYSSHEPRERVRAGGARPAIPTERDEAAVACPAWIYSNRNLVGRPRGRPKEWRAVAARYEETAASFLGVLCLAAAAAAADWPSPNRA
jgi:transposase